MDDNEKVGECNRVNPKCYYRSKCITTTTEK